mgnify:CR=1 FL=1
MTESIIHVHRGGPLVALVGNPNCGKSALFNALTATVAAQAAAGVKLDGLPVMPVQATASAISATSSTSSPRWGRSRTCSG